MLVDFRELRLLKSDFFLRRIPKKTVLPSILPLLYGGGVVGDKRLVLDVFKILRVLTEHVYVT